MTIPVQRQAVVPGMSEATRYLCAAAHLDARFADDVLERVLYERHRALVGSPGVDLGAVVGHCLAARRRRMVRDAVLAVAGLALMAAAVLGQLRVAAFLVLLTWFVVLTEMTITRYDVIGHRLRAGGAEARPHVRSEPVRRLVDDVVERQRGNVTVYSAFSPFVGAGFEIDGWSFAINVRRGRESGGGARAEPQEFTVAELYDTVRRELARLHIVGLVTEDRLHVHGRDVRSQAELLPDAFGRPVSTVEPEVVQRYRDTSSAVVRHYLDVRVEDWSGELVLSIFLRFRRIAESLFVEASYFLLPPLVERLHRVDRYQPLPRVKEVAGLVGASLLRFLPALVMSYARLASRALAPLVRTFRDRADRLRIGADAAFDYGAPVTVRERHTSTDYRRYFQKLDKEMYGKLVERTLLEVLSDFLDAHDIDTSAFEERRSTILNNGVMVTGGSLSAENLAAGTRARASSRTSPAGPSRSTQRRVRRPAPKG
jgi:hypothetical protein